MANDVTLTAKITFILTRPSFYVISYVICKFANVDQVHDERCPIGSSVVRYYCSILRHVVDLLLKRRHNAVLHQIS